jgi:hypothetical protein
LHGPNSSDPQPGSVDESESLPRRPIWLFLLVSAGPRSSLAVLRRQYTPPRGRPGGRGVQRQNVFCLRVANSRPMATEGSSKGNSCQTVICAGAFQALWHSLPTVRRGHFQQPKPQNTGASDAGDADIPRSLIQILLVSQILRDTCRPTLVWLAGWLEGGFFFLLILFLAEIVQRRAPSRSERRSQVCVMNSRRTCYLISLFWPLSTSEEEERSPMHLDHQFGKLCF